MSAERLTIELPRSRRAAGLARAALAHWYAGEVDEDLVRRAQLLASELATNAFVHGTGQIMMYATLDRDSLRVEVIDDGQGFERTVREQDFEALGGRGLAIVDAEASRWGIHEGTTHVWFELELPGPRLGGDEKPPA
jgi:anti-sigma regulatory factor (Ser/Thr protein kinase)